MARKATVDREKVLQQLRAGKTSQSIASQFGVSRQAIDLYRKQLPRESPPAPVLPEPVVDAKKTDTPLPKSSPTIDTASETTVSLDQMIEMLILAFSAMKKLPQLENELSNLKQQHDSALAQVAQLEEREKKRLEQEARWREVQSPDTR